MFFIELDKDQRCALKSSTNNLKYLSFPNQTKGIFNLEVKSPYLNLFSKLHKFLLLQSFQNSNEVLWAMPKRCCACLARNFEPKFKHSNLWKILLFSFLSVSLNIRVTFKIKDQYFHLMTKIFLLYNYVKIIMEIWSTI